MNQHHSRHDVSDGEEHSDNGYYINAADERRNYSDEDTPDSLDIKPPQVISRYGKPKKSSSTSSRERKHSKEHRHKDRSRPISNSERDRMRHHHRSSAHSSSNKNIYKDRERSGVYEREKMRTKEYDRKLDSPDKMDQEKAMEDLRSRLLSKRKQDLERRNDEHQNYQDLSGNRNYSDKNSTIDNYDSNRYSGKYSYHTKHRSKKSIEVIDSPEDYNDTDIIDRHHHRNQKNRLIEDPELIARREKLLDANREKEKRKEKAREELEARRELQRGKIYDDEAHSTKQHSRKRKFYEQNDVVHISDDNSNEENNDENEDDDNDDDDDDDDGDEDDSESNSGSNTKSEYSDSEKSEDDLRTSPLSVGDLTKSDHRRRSKSRSRSHSSGDSRSPSNNSQAKILSRSRTRSRSPSRSSRSRSNSRSISPLQSKSDKDNKRSTKIISNDDDKASGSAPPTACSENIAAAPSVELEECLPNYYPGIQGCRSVEEFKHLNHIAEGTYGIVYRAMDKRTEEIVALKRLKMEKEREGFPITSLREINTLLKGQHPNIVTVREIVVGCNMDKIFIVMDYVEHDFKTLMETMKAKNQSFLPGEVKCLTQQLLRAVAHLHDNWILHRDLKTSNLLLSHKGILKVGDFGLAREYGSPLKPYTSVVVTLWYRAPELLLCCKEYSTPIDMWSVGCIFAEFLSMSPLFPGQSETDQLNKIFKFLGTPNENIWPGYNQLPAVTKIKFTEYPVSNVREKFGRHTSDLGLGLLQGLLTYDPKQRLTADQALRSNYFKELPLPIDPAMLPTWPAKSELGAKKVAAAASPKPPSGGGKFKKLAGDIEENHGFILNAGRDNRQMKMGPGFSLKF